jgi:short-subunit dehydrogenase
MAVAFAKAGATVGICARREDRLREVLARCAEYAPSSRMWVTDLSVPEEVDGLATAAVEELGGVDVLVNNAGIPKRRHVTRLDIATVQAVANIDYVSPVRLTLALLPPMLERGEGRIINVSSVAATLSSPGEAAYAAAKAALSVWSEGMAVDLWDTGVKVLVVYPGVVDTELFTLPDNDPFTAEVEKITVDECVAAVMEALGRDDLQLYVPAWFGDVAARKAADVRAFLAGTAAYVRGR